MKPVVFGPHTEDFSNICRALQNAGGAFRVHSAEALEDALARLLEDPLAAERMGRRARRVVETNRGAAARNVDGIADMIVAAIAAEDAEYNHMPDYQIRIDEERAMHWLEHGGRLRRATRGIYLSALRSLSFNRVLSARVTDGSWQRLLDGEISFFVGIFVLLLSIGTAIFGVWLAKREVDTVVLYADDTPEGDPTPVDDVDVHVLAALDDPSQRLVLGLFLANGVPDAGDHRGRDERPEGEGRQPKSKPFHPDLLFWVCLLMEMRFLRSQMHFTKKAVVFYFALNIKQYLYLYRLCKTAPKS